jgi:hypothetical protein
VIVVVGRPGLGAGAGLSGRAAAIALAAAAAGSRVELVGSVGDDAAGNEVVVRLGRAGVGHAAVLRDPAGRTPIPEATAAPLPRLDAADVGLGLGYLAACRVIVVAEPLPPDVQAAVREAADYHGAVLLSMEEESAERIAAAAVERDRGGSGGQR